MKGFNKGQLKAALEAEKVSKDCIRRILGLAPDLESNEAFPQEKLLKNTQRTLSVDSTDCDPLMRALSVLFNNMNAIDEFTEVFLFCFVFFSFFFFFSFA